MWNKKLKLIAYIRTGDTENTVDEQKRLIENHCLSHGYQILRYFEMDTIKPSHGLSEALEAVEKADGLIVADLSRFVQNIDDQLRDIRPIISKLLHEQKPLFAVLDGIETLTPSGQEAAMTVISQWCADENCSSVRRTNDNGNLVSLCA
jgi:DNA invertase Pin-like site-specific DNA recombinase